ncbi:MAG: primosomal protein N' [Bacteroidota bacterium]
MTQYVDIIIPIPLRGSFTYVLPETLLQEHLVGCRVVVPFGKKKKHTGIIHAHHQNKPEQHELKEVLDILDALPKVNSFQLRFFQWMADYYMCTIGEVVNAALPAALKLSRESFISLNHDQKIEEDLLDERELLLLQLLEKQDLTLTNAGEILGLKFPYKVIKKLRELQYIDLFERVKDKFHPKKVTKIRLTKNYAEEEKLEKLVNSLEAKPKQQDVLLTYLNHVQILEDFDLNKRGMLKSNLQKEVSTSSIATLKKNGVIEEFEEIVSRLMPNHSSRPYQVELSADQEKARVEIEAEFIEKNVVLLHGATGSGKTELYIQLIQKELDKGNQVLYLLPEIALTTQIISRLSRAFQSSFGIYHSRYSDNERAEVWDKVLSNEFQLVVGVRSAVFLPFSRLSLIVVDEEHESSYKQFEPAPRYHARDSAIFLSTQHQAKVLLGTATPSMESYTNALDEKYGLVQLDHRFGEAYQPSIEFANVLKQQKHKKLKGNFSEELVNGIQESLDKQEQVILFQNRRGYAAYISCDHCANIPKCPNCAVSLTYHQFNNRLVCHYCGYHQPMQADCLVCGNAELRQIGFGTEELEEELTILFPKAVVQRMDLDTTRSKFSYERIIESFEEGAIDILVGTQMVSKGLDFDKVNLVGVFGADRMIHFPHFRSHERAFQLITQVSGRAGRKSRNGKVIIQTRDPKQPLLHTIQKGSYPDFYKNEILERDRFHYPPYRRLIILTIKHRDKNICLEAAKAFAREIRKSIGNDRVLGPTEPMIAKIRNLYLQEIVLKIEKTGTNISGLKEYLWSVKDIILKMPAFKTVGVVFDVDPS